MSSYGFLGLGIMGKAMAANLVKAGFEVTVWNRTQEKCLPLVEAGAKLAETPREVVETCPVVFAMLADPAAAQSVCFGPDGVLEGAGAGTGYVDMSTVDAETSTKIAQAITEKGGRFLEAPVSGSKKPAEDGALVILAAGDRNLYEEVAPAFEVMGKMHPYLGAVGNGARMKLVVNMVMGEMMAAFCEGLGLAAKAGLDTGQLLEVLDAGAMANPMFRLKGPLMLAGEFSPHFPLKHMEKDMRLALALGKELGQPLSTAAAANKAFEKALEMDLGDEDFSSVFKAIKK